MRLPQLFGIHCVTCLASQLHTRSPVPMLPEPAQVPVGIPSDTDAAEHSPRFHGHSTTTPAGSAYAQQGALAHSPCCHTRHPGRWPQAYGARCPRTTGHRGDSRPCTAVTRSHCSGTGLAANYRPSFRSLSIACCLLYSSVTESCAAHTAVAERCSAHTDLFSIDVAERCSAHIDHFPLCVTNKAGDLPTWRHCPTTEVTILMYSCQRFPSHDPACVQSFFSTFKLPLLYMSSSI